MDKQSEEDAYRVQPPQWRGVLQRVRIDDLSDACSEQILHGSDGSNGNNRAASTEMPCNDK
jgi:hypothetical protein